MKTNYVFALIGFVVILMSVVVLAGCQPEATAVAAELPVSSAPQAATNPELRPYEQYRAQKTAAREAGSFSTMDPIDLKLANYVRSSTVPADVSAARWNAMGAAYAGRNATVAADVSAARWSAMGAAYERAGMLGVSSDGRIANKRSGAVYAIDPVDMKLFNAAQSAPSYMPAQKAGTVYAVDPVDLKLFNAAGSAPAAVAEK